ncbi:MAG: isochorismate synthase [Chloroflexota bacterium]|nr:isochorismate synthase [Chloroflexota bacterium]
MIIPRAPAAEEQRSADAPSGLAAAACAEATRRREPVLLSDSRPSQILDALQLYRRARRAGHAVVYWEQPSRGAVLVAVGGVRSLTPRGEQRFAQAADAWRALVAGAVANCPEDLVAIGGFAFEAGGTRAAHWSAFGDAALVVPELLYRCDGGGARLVRNVTVRPGESPGDVAVRAAPPPWLRAASPPEPSPGQPACAVRQDPSAPDRWDAAVRALTAEIDAGRVEKVVLAREVVLDAPGEIDEAAALARLRAGYPDCTVFAVHRGGATLIGATPERLVRVDGRRVRVSCLAGSARRGAAPEDDAAIGAALLADGKERREHQLVVRMIAGALTPLCRDIDVPPEPVLMRMPNVQHLSTPVEGTLAGDVGVLALVERLHPTPAVGGLPRGAALRLLRRWESFDRGWYAGPVGWVDARGDGEFAVAIRSALLRGREARLFAGCGIVAGSDPRREYEESSLKLRPMLWALNQA